MWSIIVIIPTLGTWARWQGELQERAVAQTAGVARLPPRASSLSCHTYYYNLEILIVAILIVAIPIVAILTTEKRKNDACVVSILAPVNAVRIFRTF